MTEYVRRRPFLCFYVLAFVLGAVFISLRSLDPTAMGDMFKTMRTDPWHPNIVTSFPYVVARPVLVTGYLFPLAPSFAAIIVVAIAWRGAGLRRLFAKAFWSTRWPSRSTSRWSAFS